MPIIPGEELSDEDHKALLRGAIDHELEAMRNALQMYGVPANLIERVFARCREQSSANYAADFMIAWMVGERSFPEAQS